MIVSQQQRTMRCDSRYWVMSIFLFTALGKDKVYEFRTGDIGSYDKEKNGETWIP